ncbi:GreA/GreB family elongation factor [Chloroflexota bacterium]
MVDNLSLGEVATRFLNSIPSGERERGQQEVYRFARWYGFTRPPSELKPPDIGRYSEYVSSLSSNPVKSLEPVRAFLAYASKSGLTKTNLATHVRAKKSVSSKTRKSKEVKSEAEQVTLTPKGFARLNEELESLHEQRPKIVEEIQKAAADKDFRENAPLEAAREQLGYLEGRIKELESTLNRATIIKDVEGDTRIDAGYSIVLNEVATGDDMQITLVHASEANPARGKISLVSPMGKALLGHKAGDTIEVTAPAGTLRYRVAQVNHS